MKSILKIILICAIAFGGVTACKTSEANYRAAYEKTIAARQADEALDSTIYGDYRRQMSTRTVKAGDGREVEVRTQPVRVTPNSGALPENLKRYNVAVGQFKQLFNARSLRNRLADAGYPEAMVLETGEPYYYVVAGSYSDAGEAADALAAFEKAAPIAMKVPLPFILDATARVAR